MHNRMSGINGAAQFGVWRTDPIRVILVKPATAKPPPKATTSQ